MVNRLIGVGLFSAGAVIGVALTGLRPEPVASAQAGLQRPSWTGESKGGAEVVAPWLGAAARVELTAAGLSIAGRYAAAACRQ
jgi:hypothetical protein